MTVTTALKHIKNQASGHCINTSGTCGDRDTASHQGPPYHGGDMSRTHLSSPAQLQPQESLPTHFGAGLGLLTGDSLCPECSLTMTPDITPSLTDAPSQTDNEKTH